MIRLFRNLVHKFTSRIRFRDFGHLLEIGRHTYGIDHLRIHHWNDENICRIGSFCSIADSVHIFLGGNHRSDWITSFPFAPRDSLERGKMIGGRPSAVLSRGNVFIGNDVWIGSHVSIMSGVSIGDGAVIAAYSHVVKDVDSYQVVGGNPAGPIGYRFDVSTRARLSKAAWWNWPLEVIVENSDLLCSPADHEALARIDAIAEDLFNA